MGELAYRKLSAVEIDSALSDRPGWRVEGGLICREFGFKTYKDGVVFASAVGFVADRFDHHPDILIGYQKVTVSVNTHSVGGMSPYDFELARRVDGLIGE